MAIVNLPAVTVARSAFAHDAAVSVVAESDDEHPVSVSAAAITTAEKIPKRFFTSSPLRWIVMSKEYKEELSMSTRELYAKSHASLKDLKHLGQSQGTIAGHLALDIARVQGCIYP